MKDKQLGYVDVLNSLQENTNNIIANKNNADEQLTDLQTALCEVYELVLGGTV